MKKQFYVFEVRDSDGNDVTIYDVVLEATSRDEASAALWKHLESAYPGDETDGGYGTFHPCDCHCDHSPSRAGSAFICEDCADSWECSHGGLLTNEDADGPEVFATRDEAMAACRVYHCLIDLTPVVTKS